MYQLIADCTSLAQKMAKITRQVQMHQDTMTKSDRLLLCDRKIRSTVQYNLQSLYPGISMVMETLNKPKFSDFNMDDVLV
jgi:hypothetical protein